MKKPALIIQELSMYKIPGFPTGMEPITSLASHINVIAGPNASGKSSIARIIQDMIWKQNIGRIHIESRLVIDDRVWDIKIDNGHYLSQCEGLDDTLTSIPAYDESKRYLLALHELIKEDDRNLAQKILEETIGGYSLQNAQQNLGFKGNTPNLGLLEFKDFESKRRNANAVESKQIELQKDEKRLNTLKDKYDEAKNAFNFLQFYTLLTDYLQAKNDYELLEIKGSSYPEQMALLDGNEDVLRSKLEEKIEDTGKNIEQIIREKKTKEDELFALQLPEGGYDRLVLDELNGNIDDLASLERDLQNKCVAIKKSEAETRVVLNELFSTLKSEDLITLDLENIDNLDDFFKEAYDVLNKKQVLEKEIKQLDREKQKQNHTEEELHIGIRLLLNWFEKETAVASLSKKTLWILLALALVTVSLTYFFGWLGGIGVLVMFVYVLIKIQNMNAGTLRETRISDYQKTSLREPMDWKEEDVSRRLEELYEELQAVKAQNEISRRLEDLRDLLEEIQPEFQALETKRQAWIKKVSSIPELVTHNIESYSGLYWLLKNLLQWQKLSNELRGNRLSYEEEEKVYLRTLTKINLILAKVNVIPAIDAASAKAILKKMNEDESERSRILRDSKNLDDREFDFSEIMANYKDEVQSIYSKLNLELDSKQELSSFLAKKESYDQWVKDFENAQLRSLEKENVVKSHSLYVHVKDELPVLQIYEAEQRKESYDLLSSKAEDLNTEIATIEAHINKEKTGRELEIALTEMESALDNLEDHYNSTVASNTGDIIVNGLKKRTLEHSRSKVFNRANELFNKITYGHYELILDETGEGSFRAKDTVLNQGLHLDHLSSGTRIQLLIAVRLAFIESQESGIKLPILVDEVLANSDDLRAKQIIEALIEISKEGRQVFYFTAQTDELKKWNEYIVNYPEINAKTIVLKGQADAQPVYRIDKQEEMSLLSFFNLPSPSTYSNEEYRKLLSPPSYSLLKDTPQRLYLSYLIEDNELLHDFLQRGIQYYGHLKSFVKHQGEIEGLEDSILEEINCKVELLECYQELYQKGRPKPIDREVLYDSGCVSATFIDAVDNKLKELDQDPARLIESLKAGEVSRFSRAKIQDLEDYFFEKNYLNNDKQLTPEDLNIQLHAILSRMELSTKEAKHFLQMVAN